MFIKKKELIGLDLVLDLATTQLLDLTPGTTEYEKVLEQVERLNKIANSQKSEPIKKNEWLLAITNLVGIGVIVRHEHFNIITSKAIGFVRAIR